MNTKKRPCRQRGSRKAPLIKTKLNKAKSPIPSKDDDDDGKWYYYGFNKARRVRYTFCSQCNHKTFSKRLLNTHAELYHPNSTTKTPNNQMNSKTMPALLPITTPAVKEHLPCLGQCVQKVNQADCEFCSFYSVENHSENHLLGKQVGKKKRWVFRSVKSYSCSYCSQRIKKLSNLKRHEMLHIRKNNHQCPSCSFSVKTRNHLMRHFNIAHAKDKKISIKDVNDDIFIDMKLDDDRLKFMKKKVPIAEKAVKKTISNRNDCRDKINQMIGKKKETEIDLQNQKFRAIEIELSFLDGQSETKDNLASVEESIVKLKDVLGEIDSELEILQKQEAHLSEAVKEAEKSFSKIMQTLYSLRSESKK